jgi:hypothetical protein
VYIYLYYIIYIYILHAVSALEVYRLNFLYTCHLLRLGLDYTLEVYIIPPSISGLKYLINYMKQNPSREARSCSTCQETPSLLRIPKVQYVQRDPPLASILRMSQSTHILFS